MEGGTARALTKTVTDSVVVLGTRLEVAWAGDKSDGPTLVFLHEGLGSVSMWRDFPERVAQETGRRALVYSRRGYGRSEVAPVPRALTYMHEEARTVLPALLKELEVRDAVIVGHSDGGSIALIYAGSVLDASSCRVHGLVLMAPHVFCEEISVASIREAREAFVAGDLRSKLYRYHGQNTDGAFWGWNDAWLDPGFLKWNIEGFLPNVRVPVLAIQGADDRYGTLAQIDAIERGVSGRFQRLVVEGCGHDPTRDAPAATRAAIKGFLAGLPGPVPIGP